MELKKISQEELNEILEKHQKWLNEEEGGKLADLSDIDLSSANLSGIDLRFADLSDIDLRFANLSGTDLRFADLSDTDLRFADLSDTDLSNANLKGAALSNANLSNANLRSVNLKGANLSNANFRDADISDVYINDADFKGTDLDFSCFPLWCGSLYVHIDERQAYQLLYHLLRNVSYSKNISEDLKQKLLTPELTELANRFHRIKECGEITAYKDFK